MRNSWGFEAYTSAERDALTNLVAGMCIYNTTSNKLNFYNGTDWQEVTSADEA